MAATIEDARALICDLCSNFYKLGWVSGTGGGISIRVPSEKLYVIAPSGVQKERMSPDDMYVIDDSGNVINEPTQKPWPAKTIKCSECQPLFVAAFELRNAGAVLHSHALESVMVTLMDESATEFRVNHLEMIKGIKGHGYADDLVIPIIENTPREAQLTESLREAINKYPKSNAVLVRRHGVYIWGDDWINAKTQAECYHYLFQAALQAKKNGIDVSVAPAASTVPNGPDSKQLKAIVLDIEGTITSISYISTVMFPYVRTFLRKFLKENYKLESTQKAIQDIRTHRLTMDEGAVPSAKRSKTSEEEATSEKDTIDEVESIVLKLMDADEKVAALKNLQGLVWKEAFKNGQLICPLFADVKPALQQWKKNGLKIYIYSSGSRMAQKMLLQSTEVGDVTTYIDGYFDTVNAGNKKVKESYAEIALTLGLSESPDEIMFFTDAQAEHDAAISAQWRCQLSDPNIDRLFT